MKKYTCKLITFGRSGETEYYVCGSRMQGYSSPETWKPREDTDYSDCLVLDFNEAIETDSGFNWVFKGPLVDVSLPDGACDSLEPSDINPAFATAMGGNSYGTMLGMQVVSKMRKEKRGPLDRVSRKEYVEGWMEHNAKFGQVIDGALRFECEYCLKHGTGACQNDCWKTWNLSTKR